MFKLFKKRNNYTVNDVLVIYGTKTGNSKLVAESTVEYLLKNRVNAQSVNMSKCKPDDLKNVKKAFFVVSTHDDGTPPPSAKKFYKQLESDVLNQLAHLEYSVCSLGDSSYDSFCEAGIELNQKLRKLGAKNCIPNIECDVEFATPVTQWIKSLVANAANDELSFADKTKYKATVTDRILLQTNEEGQETYHLELAVETEMLDWQAGDLVDVIPKNSNELIDKILKYFILGEEHSTYLENKELTLLNERLIADYATKFKQNELLVLLNDKVAIGNFVRHANVYDLISIFSTDITFDEFVSWLPEIKVRQYSLSNSPINSGRELHLILKTVHFNYNQYEHRGAASTYLNKNLGIGAEVEFSITQNLDFQLNESKAIPYLMVANGTGIAPFRGFLQKLKERKHKQPIWLLWGEQKHDPRNLYWQELNAFQNELPNLRIDFISSRAGEEFSYVQNQLEANHEQIKAMVNDGAEIYLCGSKAMGKASIEAIQQALGERAFEKFTQENKIHQSIY